VRDRKGTLWFELTAKNLTYFRDALAENQFTKDDLS